MSLLTVLLLGRMDLFKGYGTDIKRPLFQIIELVTFKSLAEAIVDAIRIYKQDSDYQLQAMENIKGKSTDQKSPEADKIYRIEFLDSNKEKSVDNKVLKGMQEVWHYYENGRYHYTFGKAESLNQAKDLYHRAVISGKIKRKYLKSAEIIELLDNRIISRVNASE